MTRVTRSRQLNCAKNNPVVGQRLDDAIALLSSVTDRVEGRGEEVEPGPALVRLLGIIEHVEAVLDRNFSPETVDRAVQHLEHALHGAAAEIDASHGRSWHAAAFGKY